MNNSVTRSLSYLKNAHIFGTIISNKNFWVKNMKNKYRTVSLETDFEKDLLSADIPYAEYPRPMLKRDSYISLNGIWDFKIQNSGKSVYAGEILVPFVPESRISEVFREINDDDTLVYFRKFYLDTSFIKDRVILHIGASDQYTTVFVNNKKAGENVGGYLPIDIDITDFINPGENELRIEVCDPLDTDLAYGKQTKRRGGMWYTKISGIWQSVWLESVPDKYIVSIKVTPDLMGADIEVTGGTDTKVLYIDGKEYTFTGKKFRVDIESPRLWTTDDPYLYEFTLVSGDDTVHSYFGLRTVEIKEFHGRPLIALNGKPVFFHGLLDQGYFSDGIFLPASPRGYAEDILKMKSCGFNMLRKHIKLEPELFYYYCDKYGMLVFQDMINSGKYNFLIDTALPTMLLRRGISHRASKCRREDFEKTCQGIINTLYNHPSVVYYTIFNEGWGQFDAPKYYREFKSLDPTRIWDTTSGWFKVDDTDVESDHVYFKPIKLKPVKKRPMVLSEFGGYSCKIDGHSFNLYKTYGYKYFESTSEFQTALVTLYENEVVGEIEKGLCATVLTQLSDVEDETNGILTYDRKIMKVDSTVMTEIAETLYRKFNEIWGEK